MSRDKQGKSHTLCESFGQAFLKACAHPRRVALVALRRARNSPIGVSFLLTWQSLAIAAELAEPVFICAFGVKEKSG